MDTMDYQVRVLDKLDAMQVDITQIKVELAKMPSRYVSREEADAVKKEASITRRFVITSFIAIAALGVGYLNLVG